MIVHKHGKELWKNRGKAGGISAALCAVFLFVSFNLVYPHVDRAITLAKTKQRLAREEVYLSLEHAIDQLDKCNPRPTTVLLGSSLVMAPVWTCDKTHFNDDDPPTMHHQSRWLEQLLKEKGLADERVVSLALAGEVVSDAYIITDKLLSGDKKPDAIVFGVAPRDLMDDTLSAEALTPVFQRLVGIEDLTRIAGLSFSTLQEKGDFVFGRILSLYALRGRLQTVPVAQYKRMLVKVIGEGNETKPAAKSLADGFMMHKDRNWVWQKSKEEYKERYKCFSQTQFEKQRMYLDALLKLAQERDIKMILVNMPLSSDNLSLLPEGLYDSYLTTIRNAAKLHGATLVDLSNDGSYVDEHFYDTVHLNPIGGERFIQQVSEAVAKSTSSKRSSVASSAKQAI